MEGTIYSRLIRTCFLLFMVYVAMNNENSCEASGVPYVQWLYPHLHPGPRTPRLLPHPHPHHLHPHPLSLKRWHKHSKKGTIRITPYIEIYKPKKLPHLHKGHPHPHPHPPPGPGPHPLDVVYDDGPPAVIDALGEPVSVSHEVIEHEYHYGDPHGPHGSDSHGPIGVHGPATTVIHESSHGPSSVHEGPTVIHEAHGPSSVHESHGPTVIHESHGHDGPIVIHDAHSPSGIHGSSSLVHETHGPTVIHESHGSSGIHGSHGPSVIHGHSSPSISHNVKSSEPITLEVHSGLHESAGFPDYNSDGYVSGEYSDGTGEVGLGHGHGSLGSGSPVFETGHGSLDSGSPVFETGHGSLDSASPVFETGHGSLDSGHGSLSSGHGSLGSIYNSGHGSIDSSPPLYETQNSPNSIESAVVSGPVHSYKDNHAQGPISTAYFANDKPSSLDTAYSSENPTIGQSHSGQSQQYTSDSQKSQVITPGSPSAQTRNPSGINGNNSPNISQGQRQISSHNRNNNKKTQQGSRQNSPQSQTTYSTTGQSSTGQSGQTLQDLYNKQKSTNNGQSSQNSYNNQQSHSTQDQGQSSPNSNTHQDLYNSNQLPKKSPQSQNQSSKSTSTSTLSNIYKEKESEDLYKPPSTNPAEPFSDNPSSIHQGLYSQSLSSLDNNNNNLVSEQQNSYSNKSPKIISPPSSPSYSKIPHHQKEPSAHSITLSSDQEKSPGTEDLYYHATKLVETAMKMSRTPGNSDALKKFTASFETDLNFDSHPEPSPQPQPEVLKPLSQKKKVVQDLYNKDPFSKKIPIEYVLKEQDSKNQGTSGGQGQVEKYLYDDPYSLKIPKRFAHKDLYKDAYPSQEEVNPEEDARDLYKDLHNLYDSNPYASRKDTESSESIQKDSHEESPNANKKVAVDPVEKTIRNVRLDEYIWVRREEGTLTKRLMLSASNKSNFLLDATKGSKKIYLASKEKENLCVHGVPTDGKKTSILECSDIDPLLQWDFVPIHYGQFWIQQKGTNFCLQPSTTITYPTFVQMKPCDLYETYQLWEIDNVKAKDGAKKSY